MFVAVFDVTVVGDVNNAVVVDVYDDFDKIVVCLFRTSCEVVTSPSGSGFTSTLTSSRPH